MSIFGGHWIFICYRRGETGDSPGAMLLARDLRSAFGKRAVYRDLEKQEIGNWPVNLLLAIKRSRVFIVLIDEAFIRRVPDLQREDDFVRRELSAALSQPDVEVIGVLHNGHRMPAAKDLPSDLRLLLEMQAYQIMDLAWPEQMSRIVDRVRPFRRSGRFLWAVLLAAGIMMALLAYLEMTCSTPLGVGPWCATGPETFADWWRRLS